MRASAPARCLVAGSALALAGLLGGCLGGAEGGATTSVEAAPSVSEEQLDAELRARAQRLLDRRAQAVRDRDEAAFTRLLGGGPEFRARQLRWFRNVVQLPLQRLDYEVLDTDWEVVAPPRWGERVLVPTVVQRSRLRGFDRDVVEREIGLAIAFAGPGGGRGRIVADREPGGEPMFRGTPAPWDLVAVQVRTAPGVLGIFDDQGVAAAPEVMRAASEGVDDVSGELPFDWPRRVVVYHVSEPEVMDTFADVPGGSVELLGALTFPTYTRPEVSPVASSRVLVMPGSVAAGERFLRRIVRHELVHVALGERDDGAPTWVSEGLAEWLAAEVLPVGEREIPTVAVQRAQQRARGMPESDSFNGPDQDWHYALSWMALDQVAAADGPGRVWALLDAFAADPVGAGDEGQDEVLRAELGYDAADLARRAQARIRELYG